MMHHFPWQLRGWLCALLAGTVMRAAEPAPFLPALSLVPIPAEEAAACAALSARINPVMKAAHGVPLFLRVYAGEATGETATAFVLSPAPSFTALAKNDHAFASDAGLTELSVGLRAIVGPASRTLLKAVRFDGTHAPGWLHNSWVTVPDEAAYLRALEQLRVLFDRHGFDDVRLNTFRIVAGRTANITHLLSMNTPSAERLASVLDALATAPWAADWHKASAALRTVVRDGTFREVVP